MKYNGAVTYQVRSAAKNSDTSFNAVTSDSSTDLVNWTFENNILTANTPNVSWRGRLRVVYNANTRRASCRELLVSYLPVSIAGTPRTAMSRSSTAGRTGYSLLQPAMTLAPSMRLQCRENGEGRPRCAGGRRMPAAIVCDRSLAHLGSCSRSLRGQFLPGDGTGAAFWGQISSCPPVRHA